MSAPRGLGARAKLALVRIPGAYVWTRRAGGWLRYALRRPHEPEFEAFGLLAGRAGLLLDVGANTGQSAMSFRIFDRSSPILSIEPLRFHERDLRILRRMLRDFDYRIFAAGEADGEATIHVPYFRGVPLTGESSLRAEVAGESHWASEQLGSAAGQVELRAEVVPVRRLDGLELDPAFIKIDVEGFEPQVLRGLAETLGRCDPVLLIERSDSEREATEILAGMGFAPYAYDPASRAFVSFAGQPVVNLFFARPGAEGELPLGRRS